MQEKYIQEDEIDLRELLKILLEKKLFIIVFTFIVTICAVTYVLLKNPIPLYKGSTLIEIGEIQSKTIGTLSLDNPNNLSEVLHVSLGIDTFLPKGTTKLLEISTMDTDPDMIKRKLEKSIEFILNRHIQKAKFYDNYIMTHQIGEIQINSEAINKPKKMLIVSVACVTGFIVSIFLVFIMQFIQNFRGEKND